MKVNDVMLRGRFQSQDLWIKRNSKSESVKTFSGWDAKYSVSRPELILDFGILGGVEHLPLEYIYQGVGAVRFIWIRLGIYTKPDVERENAALYQHIETLMTL